MRTKIKFVLVCLFIISVVLTACSQLSVTESSAAPRLLTLTPTATANVLPVETATSTVVAPTEAPTEPPPPTNPPDAPTEVVEPPTEPAPEPTQDPWPPEMATPGRSKIGLHVILNEDVRILEFVRRTKPAVIKTVDNFHWLADVKSISPRTVTIGRHTQVPNRNILDNKDPSQYPDPAQFAADFINLYLSDFQAHPYVDYWEGWNEFPPNSPSRWDWYTQFEAARACQMRDLGLSAAVGGFSAGTPEYVDMARFLPAIEAIQRCGGIFTLHEYSAPTMQSGVAAGIPNAPESLKDRAGSLTLRYRYWYEGYLKPRGLTVPLVISEAGIDGWVGEGCPLDPRQGWYGCTSTWESLGLEGPAWQVFMNQINWYDHELQQDDFVIGMALFTAGTSHVADWATFNMNDMLVPLAVSMASQPQ